MSDALGTLAMGGSLTTLGYAAGRKSTIDVTDIILEARQHKEFFAFCATARDVEDCLESDLRRTGVRSDQTDRGPDFVLRMQPKRCDIRSKAGHSAGPS